MIVSDAMAETNGVRITSGEDKVHGTRCANYKIRCERHVELWDLLMGLEAHIL